MFRREIFDLIKEGEDLVEEPFHRLIDQGKLTAYPYEGFWAPMDTLKDRTILENLLDSGERALAPERAHDSAFPKRALIVRCTPFRSAPASRSRACS